MKRRVFILSAALAPWMRSARADAMQEAMSAVLQGATPREGRVKMEVPPLVENGNTVPFSVTVDSPMTESDHVRSIHVFNEKNPQPNIGDFFLGPRSGRASVATRIRLADTQTVVALAQLSDGSWWSGSAHVIVTLAACTEIR